MAKVSILIPTRGEEYQVFGRSILQKTVEDIYEKATGKFEVIVAFDGPPYQELPNLPNLICLYLNWAGTKVALNEAAKVADGKYIFKVDAHCMFAEGFDETLQADIEDNWVVSPRFYVLNAEEWKWQDNRFYDYFYLPCPLTDERGFRFKAGGHWLGRTKEKLDLDIDENMKLHGSGFFMSRDYYWNYLDGLDPHNGAGSWNGEDIEVSLKTWLGPGNNKLMVNKKTWYAHMHRGGQRPREYGVSWRDCEASTNWSARYWLGNKWDKRVKNIEWLVDKFSPVPTWPDDWKDRLAKWRASNE